LEGIIRQPHATSAAIRAVIVQKTPQSQPADFALAWYFALGREAGIPLYSDVTVDAHSGEILRADRELIVQ
jgi:hypothetical protein